MIFTRKEYMDSPTRDASGKYDDSAATAAHRRYYGQFVNERTIAYVVARIGGDAIVSSSCEHFNDIPLGKWDALVVSLPLSMKMRDAGDYATLAGLVCIAKEAAQQYRERNMA